MHGGPEEIQENGHRMEDEVKKTRKGSMRIVMLTICDCA
jgi:hypothetical protein